MSLYYAWPLTNLTMTVTDNACVHWYYPSTLNISALHCVSLMGKVNTMEYLGNLPPAWAGVASDIEVKVRFSPLGGAAEVHLHFSNLRPW